MGTFRSRVDLFLRDHPEVSPTKLGLWTVNDPSFVADLRHPARPRCPRSDTVELVDRFMRDYARSPKQTLAAATPEKTLHHRQKAFGKSIWRRRAKRDGKQDPARAVFGSAP